MSTARPSASRTPSAPRAQMSPPVPYALPGEDDEDTLVDLIDRLLDKGVVVAGDLRLTVADVDLIFVGLKLFVSSVDTIEATRSAASLTRAQDQTH